VNICNNHVKLFQTVSRNKNNKQNKQFLEETEKVIHSNSETVIKQVKSFKMQRHVQRHVQMKLINENSSQRSRNC
jgi:hypothetical protein